MKHWERQLKTKFILLQLNYLQKKGFAATSVQDIADTAGISTRLLYPHNKTKDDLLNEVVSYAAVGLEKNVETFKNDSSPV